MLLFRFLSAGRAGILLCVLVGVPAFAYCQNAANSVPDSTPEHFVDSGKKHASPAQQPESELSWIAGQSFGHFHIYVSTWWSELAVSGVEYDRHVWGSALGARLDYSGEFLPVMILRQPAKTDPWGNPESKDQEILYGMGISPIGARLLWRNGKRFRPYFNSKGGLAAFTKKVASQDASYLNFTLQFGVGSQFTVSPKWDGHVGLDYFHISNAFMAPSNPGIDSSLYTFGVTYHPGARR